MTFTEESYGNYKVSKLSKSVFSPGAANFNMRTQGENDTMASGVTALYMLALHCNYGLRLLCYSMI
jgi:hypothetical protein